MRTFIDQSRDTTSGPCHPKTRRSVGDSDRGESSLDVRLGHHPERHLPLAGSGLEHPCRLAGDPERREDRAVRVVDVGESQAMTVDEVVDFRLRAVPTDPNDGDLSGPFLAGRLDRGGFTVAGDSIRRPKPKGHRGADVSGPQVAGWCSRCRTDGD